MNKNIIRLHSPMPVIVLMAAAAMLSACNPTDKIDTNASDSNTAVKTVTDNGNVDAENAADVAREMHSRMKDDQAMHDSMKGGAMADDGMTPMGNGQTTEPSMKGMGDKATADSAPKDKSDPKMPMSDDMDM